MVEWLEAPRQPRHEDVEVSVAVTAVEVGGEEDGEAEEKDGDAEDKDKTVKTKEKQQEEEND